MLKRIPIGIVLNACALYITTYALDSVSYEGGWKFFVLAGIIIGTLNVIVKPILKIVSFPLIFITAGLFFIAINAVILFLTKYLLNVLDFSGIVFKIEGIGTYLIAALVFGIVNWIEHLFFHKK